VCARTHTQLRENIDMHHHLFLPLCLVTALSHTENPLILLNTCTGGSVCQCIFLSC